MSTTANYQLPIAITRSKPQARLPRPAVLAAVVAVLAGCAATAPKNQAEFNGYVYRMVLRDVRQSACQYGPYRTRYPDVPARRSDEFEGGTISLWQGTVFKDLTCTWQSLDGTPRTESVDMQALLAHRVVKWDFTDVEVHRNEPILMSPQVRVELRDQTLRITVQAMIQYYGERLPGGARRIPYRVVTNTLLERTGQ